MDLSADVCSADVFHSVAFDFSAWEMDGALLYCGKLIIVDDETSKDINKLLNLLKDEKVTVLNQTPTYFYNLIDKELAIDNKELCLRYVIFGGEELKPNLIKNFKDKYINTKLINMYGITETTVHVTFKELNLEDLESVNSNIGTPIPTLRIFILDKDLNLLPKGIEGELCVTGDGVCKGYLNREDLNQLKFVYNKELTKDIIYRYGERGKVG